MVQGPLLLEMGAPPPVVRATAAFMILFTASATSVQYALYGALPLGYSAAYFALCGVAGVIGSEAVKIYVRGGGGGGGATRLGR